MVQRKDKELRGSSNGIVGGYHKWLKARTQEIDWLPKLKVSSEEEVQALKAKLERTQVVKEKFKTTTIKVWKECDELKDVNMATIEALEWEMKRARKQEWGLNKFQGALWGNNNKLKLQRAKRD